MQLDCCFPKLLGNVTMQGALHVFIQHKSLPVFVIYTIVEVLTKIEDYLPLAGQRMFAAESHMYNSLRK